MTKDQIIAMAREAGAAFEPSFESALRNPMWLFSPMDLNRFASLVAAKAAAEEREKADQDAKRYRFLRDNATPGIRPPEDEMPLNYMSIRLRVDTPVYSPSMWGKYVDDAIDAAIRERARHE